MNRVLMAVLSCGLAFGLCHAAEEPTLADESEQLSYSVGYRVGEDLKKQGIDIEPDPFFRGVQDALKGAEPLLSQQEMRQIQMKIQRRVAAAQGDQRKAAAEKNSMEGKAFLDRNKQKEGVKTLPSGLQYAIIEEGEGNPPQATDTVTVHYRGTLIDGTEFDSSYSRGQPATFPLNRVIKGWTEGLQLMKPGAKHRLFIPPDLAYGQRGAGAKIGPNSTLIFEVELISVR
jgi:FKBP-type peptidyl-prolyl cis-trans isomerase